MIRHGLQIRMGSSVAVANQLLTLKDNLSSTLSGMDTIFLKATVCFGAVIRRCRVPRALSTLRREGKRLIFLTNSPRDPCGACALCRRNGIDVNADELLPSSCAVRAP